MGQLKVKEKVLILIGITVFVLAGFLIYYTVNPFGSGFSKDTTPADTIATRSANQDSASSTRSDTGPLEQQTIIIENVQNNKQLAEILDIIETYSIENEIRDLKINCIKQESTDSLPEVEETK